VIRKDTGKRQPKANKEDEAKVIMPSGDYVTRGQVKFVGDFKQGKELLKKKGRKHKVR